MSSLNLLINSSCPFGQHTPPFSCNLNDLVYYPETFLKSEFPSEKKAVQRIVCFSNRGRKNLHGTAFGFPGTVQNAEFARSLQKGI